ncbi:MAG: response regulator [Candidatus Cloacimonetes bacterium]|nr:response regulator [Candidatus Cloacimonadota bacterium]
MNILIVDDNETNIYFLETLFKGYGHKSFEASNGKEALEVLQKEQIDLIISDILMPVMDGFTLCLEVHKIDQLKNIPFVFYTATYTGPKDEEFARKIGADRFIVKPCEPQVMMEHVNELLSTSHQKPVKEKELSEHDDKDIFKLYNERLIRKLEQKMLEAEKELIIRIEVEDALRRNEAILNATQKIAKIGGWEYDVFNQKIYWTNEVYNIHDIEKSEFSELPEEIINNSLECYSESVRDQLSKSFRKCVSEGIPYEMECGFTSKKGRKLIVKTSGYPVFENEIITKIYGYLMDITQYKDAEKEKESLNAQLRQSQKLESLGQLAGGVAHDFNNILSIILGYSEILLRTMPAEMEMHNELQEIVNAAKRASDLTRQLLIFSRKHVVQPKIVNINDLIKDLEKMLNRLIGENIKVKNILSENIFKIKADPGQIQQIIMNLVINARDAMPLGGEITIETNNVLVNEENAIKYQGANFGQYVELKVKDNGTGMDEATLNRIFEPFFTTKEAGKGTGLGLSTVFGIVKQSEGYIFVDSELNKGTRFIMIFPKTTEKLNYQKELLEEEDLGGKGEQILIVEDEKPLIELIENMIIKLGYKPISATNGYDALNLVKDHDLKPDLIITDIVMPGMNGRELIQKLSEILPDLRVIYISGYTDNTVIDSKDYFPNAPYLQKPFSFIAIAKQIKAALRN